MKLNQAIEYALNGEALLFLGAGFSTEAYNINDQRMGDAKQFSKSLCKEMNWPENDDLSRVSNLYIKNNSVIQLVDLLKKEFSTKDLKEFYKIVTDVNWNRVYTTNYDDVFEFASRKSNKSYSTVTIDKEPSKYNKRNIVVHINGFVGTLTPDKLSNEFKLTSSSYNTSEFSKTKWATLFRNDLNNAKAIIFIGTSLNYDLELKQIINSNPSLRSKIFFIEKKVTKSIDIFEQDAKEDFGTVEYIGLEEFTNRIIEVKKTYKPENNKRIVESFVHLNESTYKLMKPKVNDIWDLLIHGFIDDDIVRSNFSDELYLIEREETKEILSHISDNRLYVVVVHSELGNGKSCFTKVLAERAIQLGNVFVLNKSQGLKSDIEYIDSIPGKKIVIIENYHDQWHLINILGDYLNDDYKLILTARSHIHETRLSELTTKLNRDDIQEVNLNLLKSEDIDKFIPLLNKIEKWDEFHGSNNEVKKRLLIKKYESRISNILVGMLNSKGIQSQIDSTFKKIIEIESFKELLIGICINSVIDLRLSSYDLVEILEMREFSTTVKLNSEVRTLVNWDENQINIKSPIIAQYLLRNRISKTDIISTIKKMVYYSNHYDVDGKYSNLSKRLISVSNIWLLLNHADENVRNMVIELFDSLKDFSSYKDKPFFWLQYGIACLDNKIFDRAEVYFGLAYQKTEKLRYNFDTFQIDAHYARFLLENAVNSKVYDNYITFNKAHSLLMKSLNSEMQTNRYVLKQTKLYRIYWDTFTSEMNSSDKNRLIDAARYMIERVTEYEVNHKNNIEVYMSSIRSELEKLVNDIYQSASL